MPPREYLERAAKIIYATPDSTADGRITIKVLGDWIDQNENLMAMFLMFEPDEKVEENNSLFLPLKRDPSHLPILYYKYLGKRLNNEKPVDKKLAAPQSSRITKLSSREVITGSKLSRKRPSYMSKDKFTKNEEFIADLRASHK